MQPAAALRHILLDLIAHPPLPELLEMVGYPGNGFLVRIACKKEGDLVGTVNHVLGGHIRGYFVGLDSPRICDVCRRVSR